MKSYEWYHHLKKPTWAPPASLFGPVWTILYVVIATTYGYVAYLLAEKGLPFIIVLPFILNIFFNAAFTSLQFSVRSNILALIDVVLVWGTLIWAMVAVFMYVPWISYANIPYLLWVTFAVVLQFSITQMNSGRAS